MCSIYSSRLTISSPDLLLLKRSSFARRSRFAESEWIPSFRFLLNCS